MNKPELSSYNQSWPQRFELERKRLLSSLGYMTGGGIIFSTVEHVGSTAVPGLAAKPCIDIAIDTEIPLAKESVAKLTALGYEQEGEATKETQVFAKLNPDSVKLYFVNSSASALWPQMLVWRDYLRKNADVRQSYDKLKRDLAAHGSDAYEEGKSNFLVEAVKSALTWHIATTGFEPLKRVRDDLAELKVPWMVSSGWALDLFLGEPTRYHDDLDITLFYEDGLELQTYLHAQSWRFHCMLEGVYREWQPDERLEPPEHQLHARRGDGFLDILFSRQENGNWVYRRDERVTLPLERVSRSRQGIPYLAPEAVLLYKSFTRHIGPRPKDQADFERVAPHLSPEAKRWLKEAISKTNTEHPWLASLD